MEVFGDSCPVLGTKYTFNQGRHTGTSASLDKYIPEVGYVKGNICVISDLANRIKNNGTYEQVQRVANWMLTKRKTINL